LEDAPNREKLENALAKLVVENMFDKEIQRDYSQQKDDFIKEKNERLKKLETEIGELNRQADKLPKGSKEEQQLRQQANETQLELIQKLSDEFNGLNTPKIFEELNEKTRQELVHRVKQTVTFKNVFKGICEDVSVRESFVMKTNEFLKKSGEEIANKHSRILTKLSNLTNVLTTEVKQNINDVQKIKDEALTISNI
jgi:hypothetical protein